MMYIPSVIQSMNFKSLDYDGTLTVDTNIGMEVIPLITEYSDSKAHKVISALIKKDVKTINVKRIVIDGLSFSYIDNIRLCVSDKYKHKAIFQLRDNYMPLLIYSDLSEKNTYKAMLLVERNNKEIVKGYSHTVS